MYSVNLGFELLVNIELEWVACIILNNNMLRLNMAGISLILMRSDRELVYQVHFVVQYNFYYVNPSNILLYRLLCSGFSCCSCCVEVDLIFYRNFMPHGFV